MADQPILTYAVNPHSVYTSVKDHQKSVADLIIGVANRTGADVDVVFLGFTISVGTGSGDLTSDAGSIDPTVQGTQDWIISAEAQGVFRAKPVGTNKGLKSGDSVSFQLNGVVVNDVVGLTSIAVTEQTTERRVGDIEPPVQKRVSKLRIDSFQAVPSIVDPGDSTTLSWSSTGAASATLDSIPLLAAAASAAKPVPPNGQKDVPISYTTLFVLTVSGEGPSYSSQLTVAARRPQIRTHSASASQVAQDGEVTIQWTSDYADGVIFSPPRQQLGPTDSIVVHPHTTITYTLIAVKGTEESATVPITIEVPPVGITCFGNDRPLGSGQPPFTLTWQTNWASKVIIDPGLGEQPPNGSVRVDPTTQTTYTLTASGYDGPVKSGPLIVQPTPSWYQQSAPAAVMLGEAVVLTTDAPAAFLIGGKIGDAMNDKVYITTDGVSFEEKTPAPSVARTSGGGATPDRKTMFLFGGLDANGRPLNDVFSSTDGLAWAQLPAATWKARSHFASGSFASKMWILGGQTDTATANDVWSSSDGASWTCEVESAPWSPRMGAGVAVFDQKLWLCGGRDGTTYYNEVWSSPDGKTWTQAPAPPWSARESPFVAAIGDHLAVMSGTGSDGQPLARPDMWLMAKDGSWAELVGWVPKTLVPGASFAGFESDLWVLGSGSSGTIYYFVPSTAPAEDACS